MLHPLLTAGALLATAPISVEITVYNANFALVKEVRQFTLQANRQELRVEDVAAQIDPTSVSFRSLTPDSPIEVYEQNYQYDLLSPTSILEKSVGKTIRLHQLLETGQVVTTEGVLLSSPTAVVNSGGGGYQTYNGLVLRTTDGRIILNPSGMIEVLEMPRGLISRPTLMWDVAAAKAGLHQVEVAYLTGEISWSAEYVMTLDPNDTKANFNGWVTLNNRSGATYENAKLKLIAGDVRRIMPAPRGGFGGGAPRMEMAKAADQFVEEGLFEYHMYTLQRPATVRNKETKQIALLGAEDVAVRKELIFEGQRSVWQGYGNTYRPGQGYATDPSVKVNIMVEMINSEKNGLGIPLPKGKVRVYKRDASGSVQMVGEDLIDHTPREEKIRLYVGDAFDIVGERKRTDFKIISPRVVQETFEIRLRNRKRVAETVRVVEHAWAEWSILSETMPHKKSDSNTFEYLVTLQPDKEVVITYTVQTSWE